MSFFSELFRYQICLEDKYKHKIIEIMKERKLINDICMDANKNGDKKSSNTPCPPSEEEIKEDIDMINPDENTLDRG